MAGVVRTYLSLMREIAEGLTLTPLDVMARQPGIVMVYRVTVRYHDRRVRDSAATLIQRRMDVWALEVAYRGAFDGKPIQYPITMARGTAFAAALTGQGFDRLLDAPDLPPYPSADLVLIERAAGTFYHSVIVSMTTAVEPYTRIVNAVRNGLPEALKQVK